MTDKAICWDLDLTLGAFRKISYEMMNIPFPDTEKALSLKYGISNSLTDLSEEGYKHFITTSAGPVYTSEALRRTGIESHFEKVFTKEDVEKMMHGKMYRPVADYLGFSDEEAKSNMIVIGDACMDRPIDIEGLVFVEHRSGLKIDSVVTKMILEKLNELGDNDFNKGFLEMYAAATIEKVELWGAIREHRQFEIDSNIKFRVKYDKNSYRRFPIATIYEIETDDCYVKEPVLIIE